MQKARQLAVAHSLKYVAVHHMEAHALVARAARPVAFPFLCLLVSGGHNLIVIVHGVGRYALLGSTLDDAVGVCAVLAAHGPSMMSCQATWATALINRNVAHLTATPWFRVKVQMQIGLVTGVCTVCAIAGPEVP